ncbi:MAG: [LysW]-aminoadipate kinase [Gammaproteobacteria bacterium]
MILIKIGGGESINIEAVIADLADLATIDARFIIVHGANVLRDQLAEKLGMGKTILTSVSGYSSVFSDQDAIDLIMMSYAGLRNKRIVELCQRSDINAVGLTGLDGRIVQGERNKGIRVRENGKILIKRDFSGKPRSINIELLRLLIDNNYCPVMTIPIVDEKGFAINSENDDIVAKIANALEIDTVIQLIEAPGFLDDPDDENSLVERMSLAELTEREAQVEGRIKRKLLALTRLCAGGKTRVIISDGRGEHPVADALDGRGTHIQ